MHSKNMSRAFPISGRILWMVSSIILSLSSPHQATTGSKVRRVPDWCSAIHCQDCARSEVSVCSNGATSNPSGDLCGCCHSCVQIRDFGESCGSQLAVRSAPKNFVNSRSRFTVLATTSCGPGLVCINFTCERSEDEVDRVGAAPVERKGERAEAKSRSSENDGSEEPDDLRTNVITVENSHEFYYRRPDYDNVDNSHLDTDDAFTTRETDPGRSTSIPWPISLTTEMLPTTGRELSKAIESRRPNTEFDSSVHSVNVLMSGREFQLIHGREALADLKLLLQSVDKTQSTSILDEFEAPLLYERFKDVLELVNSGRKSSRPREVIDPETGVSTVDSQEHFENENRSIVETVRDFGGLGVLRKFASSRTSKLPRPRIPPRFPSKFRRKRELEDSENEGPSGEFSEVVIYDFLNDTPRTLTDPPRRWFIAREVETTSEQKLPTARLSDPDVLESTINIHITGIPRTTNSASEFELVDEERRTVASSQDHDNYDDKLEIFVSDANTEVPNFSEADESLEESANLTTSPISESYQSFESQSGEAENATDNDWRTSTSMGENSGYFGTNYEFTFPESPVVMEDGDHALALRVNETVDEFRAQLNRIETRVVVIESSLYNMMTKLGTNERSAGVANEERGYTIESDNSPYSASNATGRRRDGRRILMPRRVSLHSRNGRSFKVEDEGVAELIPVRSNRRWRTVSWQPGQEEARKVFESRGRLHPSRSGVDKIREEVHLDPGRKKSQLRRVSDSGRQDLIARRSGVRKVPKEAPTRPGKIQSRTFLSNIDTRSSTRPADIFSREQYSLRVTPLRSPLQVVRPFNSIRSSALTERTKRKSSEVDGRGRNSKTEDTPMAQESVALETQIPKPLRAREFKDFDNGVGVSPTRLAMIPMEGSLRRSLDEEDNWNWSSWDDGPALDLFVVNGEQTESSSEFRAEVSSRTRESPTIVLPMENENPGIPEESWETFYPSYLDYSESLRRGEGTEKEESPIKAEASESTTNLRRARRISAEGGKRMKRAADFSQAGQSDEALDSIPRKRSTDRQPTIQNKSSSAQEYHDRLRQVRNAALRTWLGSREELNDTNLRDLKLRISADFSQAGQSGEAVVLRPKKRSTDRQSMIQNKSSSTQEYHERLRQVRNAALRTWLGSREELNDTNLRDLKLRISADFSQTGPSGEALVSRPKKRSTDMQPTIQNKSSSAQEYHERLRQVRTAALRTWLGSSEELNDTNLTDLKLRISADFSQTGQSSEAVVLRPKKRSTDMQPTTQNKSSSAQEYYERRRQVRTAAFRTWLASREELNDTNLTDLKLRISADFSQAGQFSEALISRPKKRSTDMQPTTQNKSSSAQEYHERLRQVRNAALRTWLGSSEELNDTNLTDPKWRLGADFSQAGTREELNDTNLTDLKLRISAEGGQRLKRTADFSQAGQSGEALVSRPKKRSTAMQSTIQNKSSPAQRPKRGVQMADWLRAAQEYHERLQQVRTAALRTWLASREELDDTNFTDVKLFTREIPTYLERYRPTSTAEEDSSPNGEATHLHPMEAEDPQDQPSSIPDDDELFIEFLRNQSASLRNDSKDDARNDKSGREPSGEMSSSTARKFTIIASGNSTIRIEELPERGDEIEESPLADQSAQGSISMDRRTALTSGESEDFDHMYEGVDAEDGDFDYGDPNFALSRWLDEVDIIDASSVEIPVDKAESTTGDAPKDEEDYEVDELLSRSKRDSPLFLFRVNGEPGREVLVWPANWRDFIDRHFGRNRTGNSPRRATKRTRTRISKLGPARTAVSETIKNFHERDDEVSSSAERIGEGAEKESSMELAFARKFQESFENRPRQNKRKNVYRSNIGNYK